MNGSRIQALSLLALVVVAAPVGARHEGPRIAEPAMTHERRIDFDAATPPSIHVENVWGSVRVRGHDAPWVDVRVVENRSARDETWLEASREILNFGIVETAGTLSVGLDGPEGWKRRDPCPGCRLALEIELTVPRGASLDLTTVNDGEIRVDGVVGPISARHVNGPVTVTDGAGCGRLASVNGDVRMRFSDLPGNGACEFDTINGDMIVELPERPNVDLGIRTRDGRVVSDFEVAALPPRMELARDEGGRTNRYTLSSGPNLRLGTGGYELHFESMNGDVFIERRPQQGD